MTEGDGRYGAATPDTTTFYRGVGVVASPMASITDTFASPYGEVRQNA